MALNGIDISKWQAGIDLSNVPGDFVIVQHSFGNSIQPTFEGQINSALNAGKLIGVYHFITGDNGEIDTFINGIEPYVGRAIIALDWENDYNSAYGDWGYLSNFAQQIINRTGVRPIVYGSADIYPQLKSQISDPLNCGLWIAQYANMNATGYQSNPWNVGNYDMCLFQYASTGSLNGYGGSLDLDMFLGDRDAWGAYARSTKPKPVVRDTSTAVSKPQITPVSGDDIDRNSGNVEPNRKIAISNIANDGLYLAPSADGKTVVMSDKIYYWGVQQNGDKSFSFSTDNMWWLTLNGTDDGAKLSTEIGNGQLTQRWIVVPDQNGWQFTPLTNSALAIDLPNGHDNPGQFVQAWDAWNTTFQRWSIQYYVEPAKKFEPKPTVEPKPEPKSDPKPTTDTKPTAKSDTEISPNHTTKTDKPVSQPADQNVPKLQIGKPIHEDISKLNQDLQQLSKTPQSEVDDVATETADVVQDLLHKKALSRKTIRWIMAIGAIIAAAGTVLMILAGEHILPNYWYAIAGLVTSFYAVFSHTLGITATTK